MVDQLQVEAIIQFPPPTTMQQIQTLHGKANFLCRFITNYAEITNGFMKLLKKGVPFYWDDQVQWSFEALKMALKIAPLLSPPEFSIYFILYLASFDSTIGMVLF